MLGGELTRRDGDLLGAHGHPFEALRGELTLGGHDPRGGVGLGDGDLTRLGLFGELRAHASDLTRAAGAIGLGEQRLHDEDLLLAVIVRAAGLDAPPLRSVLIALEERALEPLPLLDALGRPARVLPGLIVERRDVDAAVVEQHPKDGDGVRLDEVRGDATEQLPCHGVPDPISDLARGGADGAIDDAIEEHPTRHRREAEADGGAREPLFGTHWFFSSWGHAMVTSSQR